MNHQFDELTKSMAQSVTRRAALKKFGLGLAGMALACFGLVSKAQAGKGCSTDGDCRQGQVCCNGACVAETPDWCEFGTGDNPCCCYCVEPKKGRGNWFEPYMTTALTPCHPNYYQCQLYCGNSLGCW